jgi:1,4-alpha-glucan branching enzyme
MKGKLAELTRGHIYLVPGGVDTREYDVAPSSKTSAFSYVLFIGRLHEVKGPGLVLTALPHVVASAGPVSAYFAGTGPEQEHLVTMAKQKGLEDHVRFLGYVSGSRKVDLIQQASFIVVPSLYEPFGLVSLEAMACGKPVIAARVGGIPEVVCHRETGLLFDAGNATQLAECMVELLLNPELRLQYGRAARHRAESYAWPKVGDRMITVYRECMAHFGK